MLEKLGGTLAIVFGIIAVGVGLVGVGEVVSGVADGATWGAMFVCMGLGGFALHGGTKMLRAGSRSEPAALGPGSAQDPESIVLALAAHGGGRVTVPEIAAKSRLSVDEATVAIGELTRRGMADSIVTEGGVVVYQIRGLLSPAQKAEAIDILDA